MDMYQRKFEKSVAHYINQLLFLSNMILYNAITIQIIKVYELNLTQKEIMEAAYLGEMCTPSQCGRMDQCVAMGPGSVGLMIFEESSCELRIIPCKTPLYFVAADLKVRSL